MMKKLRFSRFLIFPSLAALLLLQLDDILSLLKPSLSFQWKGEDCSVAFGRGFVLAAGPHETVRDMYQADCSGVVKNRSLGLNSKTWFFLTRTKSDPSYLVMIHNTVDEILSPALVKEGCFECPIHHALISHLYTLPTATSFFLDIGSNLGIYALGAAARGYRAFSFEPLLRNWVPQCYSIYANPYFHERMRLFKVALTAGAPTKIRFYLRWLQNPSAAAIVKENRPRDIPGHEGVDWSWAVPLEHLRSSLPSNGTAVVKVDVEGHECEALAGGMSYLGSIRIDYMAIEWSGDRLENCENRDEIFAMLKSNKLDPYIFQRKTSHWERQSFDDWKTWRQRNSTSTELFDMAFCRKPPSTLPEEIPVELSHEFWQSASRSSAGVQRRKVMNEWTTGSALTKTEYY